MRDPRAAGAPRGNDKEARLEKIEVSPLEVILDEPKSEAQITVKAGTTVKWTNAEKRVSHSILFTGPGGLESERIFPDESWERRFERPGQYPYTCGPHPEMKGLVVVTP